MVEVASSNLVGPTKYPQALSVDALGAFVIPNATLVDGLAL